MDTAFLSIELLEMENRTYITVNDYQRLTGLIEFGSLKIKMPETVKRLYNKIVVAKMLSPERISKNVVTMNSRILLRDLANDKEIEISITYPKDSNNLERKVSIFSEIGVALLGHQVGDTVSWKVPKGIGRFEIVEITFQPEAVGDYSL